MLIFHPSFFWIDAFQHYVRGTPPFKNKIKITTPLTPMPIMLVGLDLDWRI
jgi:hypothetical protein